MTRRWDPWKTGVEIGGGVHGVCDKSETLAGLMGDNVREAVTGGFSRKQRLRYRWVCRGLMEVQHP